MGSTGVDKGDTDENHTDLEDSLSSGAYGDSSPFIQAAEGIREAPSGPPGGDTALWARHRRLHQRQIVPNPAPTPLQAVKTVVESVVQIVVENGQSSVGAFMLPTVPTVISFPSYGQLTVPIVPAYPSSPPQTLPTVPAYPFTSAVAAITGAATEMPPPSNTAIPVPGIGPEGSSAVRGANSSDTTSSTMHMPTSSTLLMTSSSSSVQSSTPIPSRASSVPNFPFLTTGGNFSRTSG